MDPTPIQRLPRYIALALFTLCACSPQPAGDILLITVDTLRPDHLGLYGYERAASPNIDHHFSDAAIFERAYATNANTSPSIASILTGQLPHEHGVRKFYQLVSDDVRLVTDLLPAAYQTAAFVSSIVLTDEAMGMARHFDHYDDHVDEVASNLRIFERKGSRTTDAALLWIAEHRDPERPLFLWMHYMDPHPPYQPPSPEYASFEHEGFVKFDRKRINPYQLEPGVDDALDYVDRYDEEIAHMDTAVGRLLTGYGVQRELDEALLIFVADHGESMLERERWFTHGYQVFEEIIRVPLMIRGPGVEPGRRDALVSGIDLVPTILHFAGARPDTALNGVALQQRTAIPKDRTVFAEGGGGKSLIRAAIRNDQKWVAKAGAGKKKTRSRWHFDLGADPAEQKPQPWDPSNPEEVARELIDLFDRDPDPGGLPKGFREGLRIDAPKVAPRADAETIERLRALGYVE
ncbi:MAG: sulfatase [Deltaproteobacteria bacterium]|nr:sulfatase [Deltaproteobacteria bacterium]MBW2691253.1 sulfatase [Deltaproteobacteria bacterium]